MSDLNIVGGTYLERCIEPTTNQLMGSGVRAAQVITTLGGSANLVTFVGNDEVNDLNVASHIFGFSLDTELIPKTVCFLYQHPLARPSIFNLYKESLARLPLRCGDKNELKDIVLRFGLIEGDAVVHGRKVVYDPQNPRDPQPFRANGSTASELIVIANLHEGRLLAGDTSNELSVKKVASKILELERASSVILKCGSAGAFVFTPNESRNVPCFRTDRVFSIGSGDVFAAVFTYCWGELDFSIFDSAEKASRLTALYCDRGVIDSSLCLDSETSFPPLKIDLERNFAGTVYLAGPFFTMAERWLIDEAREVLISQGLSVFSPYHDVGMGNADDVVPKDLEGIKSSDSVFAIVDGLDSGTLFEIGYAIALGKPVVAFVQNESDEDLKMLSGSGCVVRNDFVTAIYQVTWMTLEQGKSKE